MSERAEKLAALFLVAASFVLFSLYSVANPLFEASDELWHYPFVQHLATTWKLPTQRSTDTDENAPWRQEGSQPPLYYALAALVTSPVDTSNWRDIRRLNPHTDMGRPTRDGNANAVVHSTAESFPWSGPTLAVHLARLVSVVLSTLTVLFVYLAAREVFPSSGPDRQAWLRLSVIVFTACVPMFAFISGSVNNDNAAATFSTLGLWWAIRLTRRGDLRLRTAAVAGLITAAGALSKSSTLGLLVLFALAAILALLKLRTLSPQHPLRRDASVALRFLLVVAVFTLVLAGWWFVRNQRLYGDLLGWNAFLDVVGRRDSPASLAQLWSEREGFVWAYWGVFGTLNVIMPPIVYDVLNAGVLLALVGALVFAMRTKLIRRRSRAIPSPSDDVHAQVGSPWLQTVVRHSPALLCAAWLLITFGALIRWTSLTPASQGRLLFPCIAVLAMGMAYGLYHLHRAVLVLAGIGLAGLAVFVPFTVIAPAYARPPAQTALSPSHPLDITLGDALNLVGYDVMSESVNPGDEAMLRLYWRAQAALPDNYSVFVHLINDDNVIVGQRDMYPGQGSLATSELTRGYGWTEHYAVRVPDLTLAQQHLRWAVGLYDLQSGQRLTVTRGSDTEQGIVFGDVNLLPISEKHDALLDYGNGMVLQGYDVQPRQGVAGTTINVTLNWAATRNVGADYTVSLQLLDDKANKIAQNDSAPAGGAAPTSSWQPNTVISDPHVLQINANAPPGVYRLLLVVYVPQDFTRLGAYDRRGQYINTEVELMRLRVK